MKRKWVSLFVILLLVVSSLSFSKSKDKEKDIVKKIEFGKYDEYAFIIYEHTKRLPKKDKMVSAVSVEVLPNVQCDYRFELTIPKKIHKIKVWNFGEWKELDQGSQHSVAIPTHGVTYRLKNNIYTITGSYSAGKKGGYIRGMFRGEFLPIGNYSLKIVVDNVRYTVIKFRVVRQFSR
ncbi:MAG: hypothetical protein OEZ36_01500 [Spirochaetota bacterium]|nr:hypothetical protein [Spirochaetota bacterium]